METIERPKKQPGKNSQVDNKSNHIKSTDKEVETIKQQTAEDYSYFAGSAKTPNAIDDKELHMRVVYGDGLLLLKEKVAKYKKRSSYKYLYDYAKNDHAGRVCILYGLRRTGKTTLLFQLLNDLELDKAVYIKAEEQNTMGDLIKDINYLTKHGIKYFLLDEITLLSDFINTSATLSDIYCAMGYKIILSGTDSLGFDFAKRDELYDRAVTIHTSYISFKEFSNVLDKNDIDEYIEYGGTLQKENMSFDDQDYNKEEVSFRSDESTRKYIDSAISHNIQRSLKNEKYGSYFFHLRELYDKNELTNAINRIVESMNHEFLLRVVEEAFVSHDLGSARQMLARNKDEEIQNALYDIDEKIVIGKLKELISVKEKAETTVALTQKTIDQIKEYLYDLDLIKDVEVRYSDGTIVNRPVFTQPGMRYSIAKALCYSLLQDEYFKGIPEEKKQAIFNKILSDVKGRMLEDIVLLESTYRKKKDDIVFKYIDNHLMAEADMVKYDASSDTFMVYEIKHSKKVDAPNQAKHLNNPKFLEELGKKFGVLKGKCVLYKGEVAKEIGTVKYLNVEYYLKNI